MFVQTDTVSFITYNKKFEHFPWSIDVGCYWYNNANQGKNRKRLGINREKTDNIQHPSAVDWCYCADLFKGTLLPLWGTHNLTRNVTLSYTVGQPISGVVGQSNKLSQGFQQNTVAYQEILEA